MAETLVSAKSFKIIKQLFMASFAATSFLICVYVDWQGTFVDTGNDPVDRPGIQL